MYMSLMTNLAAMLIVTAFFIVFLLHQAEMLPVIFRKRANGVDIGSYEVVCVGLQVRKDRLAPRELAVIKSFMVDSLRAALVAPVVGKTSYQDGDL